MNAPEGFMATEEAPEWHKHLTATALTVAAELGATWEPHEGRDARGYIIHADGWRIFLHCSVRANRCARFLFSGSYSHFNANSIGLGLNASDIMTYTEREAARGKNRPDEMSASGDRSGKQIAQSVRRRILPAVIDYTTRARALAETRKQNTEERDAAIARILAAFPGARRLDSNGDRVYIPNAPAIDVHSGGSCSIEQRFTCTCEQAVAIVKILRGEK